MKVISNIKEKRDLTRIIIGASRTGSSNIKKPIKTITLVDTNVDEVFQKISKCLESEK